MTKQEREELKTVVGEAVAEQMPIALVETLDPMVRRSTANVLKKFQRQALVGFLLLLLASLVLFHKQAVDRYTACRNGNDVRQALRLVVIQGEQLEPAFKKAFPNIPPKFFQQQQRLTKFELDAFKDRVCSNTIF